MVEPAVLFGAGAALLGLGVAVHLAVDGWLRVKRFERDTERTALDRPTDDVAARIARIEQAVEVTAVEVERIAESQRYLTRALGSAEAPAERK